MKIQKHLSILIFILLPLGLFAQIPTEVPNPSDNKPVDLSNPADIVIYIVLPICAIILFLVYRKNKRNQKK